MARSSRHVFTSESVTEGHPDKVADAISDGVLDAILAEDAPARVACETMVTTGMAVVAGEITTSTYVHIPDIVRATLGRSGKAVVRTNVGDRGCCGGDRIIPYGETWSAGPFTCFSERTGLTCERDDGHSFLLSRARLRAD